MGLFRNKTEDLTDQKEDEKVELINRPRIGCIDIEPNVIWSLERSGFNLKRGSLGTKISVENTGLRDSHRIKLKSELPPGINEQDICIIDLDRHRSRPYDKSDRINKNYTGNIDTLLLSCYPETLFDPRPILSSKLRDELVRIRNRVFLLIVFSTSKYEVEYVPVSISENSYERHPLLHHNIYSFWPNVPCDVPEEGQEVSVCDVDNSLRVFLKKYSEKFKYNQTFYHPTIHSYEGRHEQENFRPLLKNINGKIVSYFESNEFSNLMIFPQVENKGEFIKEFLTDVAPSLFPEIFPYATKSEWKQEKEYWLPNYSNLQKERNSIEEAFKESIRKNDADINANYKKYSFLHDIITETGDNLVKAIIDFLEWLGFDEVIDYDKVKDPTERLEEDLQVPIADGLIVIECKGIGGTSTDSDCSQISKIKFRRCEERKAFDVFALYIVNHQLHLPPLKRKNPPFSKDQIKHAINEKRGLLSTWQLFQLYDQIEAGIISKEEAQNDLMGYGLIDFRPKNIVLLDTPMKVLKGGKVCIVNIDDCPIMLGDEILVEKNEKFAKAKIVDIRENGKPLKEAKSGEFGIMLDIEVKQKSKLWKRD
ncbi:hypothetical protein [Maribacter sp. 2307UL18-2]|uniref:hypothetical protein n=1 Tax=Maribacter sp. 2307UL18-2 TaxID=3386274 RepID=UPI0039BC4CB8